MRESFTEHNTPLSWGDQNPIPTPVVILTYDSMTAAVNAPSTLKIGRMASNLPPSAADAGENVAVKKYLLPRHSSR